MEKWQPDDFTQGRIDHHGEVRAHQGSAFWTFREGGKSKLCGWSGVPRRQAARLALAPGVGYGGGAFNPAGDGVLLVAEGRVWRENDGRLQALTPAFGAAADPLPRPGGPEVVFVHSYEGRDVLALAVGAEDWPRVLAAGADFYMQPAWSPDGARLAWV